MEETPSNQGGIFSSVARLLQTLRNALENRFELFLVELKEERIRVLDALFLLAIGLVCAAMTLVMLTLVVVVIFWDTHRMLVLTLATVAYGVVATVALVKVRRRLLHWRAFPATIEQIKLDRSCLEKTN